MDIHDSKIAVLLGAAGMIGAALSATMPASAQTNPWATEQTTVPVTVDVLPMAEIQFPEGTGQLHLFVPPANSTIPDTGMKFVVRGNAMASVSAKPDESLLVSPYFVGNTNVGPRYLGKANLAGGGSIGYNLQVEFPAGDFVSLPIVTSGQSTPPLTVEFDEDKVEEIGFIHVFASHRWTPDATMPAVGDYHGNVIITLTASSF